MIKQRTLKTVIRTTGVGLHTGDLIQLTLKPAAVDTGIVFKRVDLNPVVEIKADVFNVGETTLSTCLIKDSIKLMGINNLETLKKLEEINWKKIKYRL